MRMSLAACSNPVGEPDAGNPHVRFDEREVEPEHGVRDSAKKGKPGHTEMPPPK
jgi:hypothetical protein